MGLITTKIDIKQAFPMSFRSARFRAACRLNGTSARVATLHRADGPDLDITQGCDTVSVKAARPDGMS